MIFIMKTKNGVCQGVSPKFTIHNSQFTIHNYIKGDAPSFVLCAKFTIYNSPFTIHNSPFTIHHSQFIIHHSPFIIHHSY